MTALNQRVRTSPAAGGGVIVMGVWCPTCREEVGPLRNGTCPTCNRLVYDEDALSARDAVAALTTPKPGGSMTATATIARCKIEGCDAEAVDRVGRYAKLCANHKEAARTASGTPAQRIPMRSGTGSVTAKAKALVPLARKLDKAQTTLNGLPSNTEAKAAFDEAARRASQAPTPDNLARVTAAAKALQTFAPKRTKAENELAQAGRAFELALRSLQDAA